jgi:hypothetical protein
MQPFLMRVRLSKFNGTICEALKIIKRFVTIKSLMYDGRFILPMVDDAVTHARFFHLSGAHAAKAAASFLCQCYGN